MQAQDESDGSFVVHHDPARAVRWFVWGLVVVLAFGGGFEWVSQRMQSTHGGVSGWLIAAAVLAAIALVAAESGHFVFDRKSRVVRWKRTIAWRRLEGTLPFDEVKDVMLESPIGDGGIPSRRITLRLKDGRVLPLRSNYATDHDDGLVKIAEQIRSALGRPSKPAPGDEIAALLAQGKVIEAIKELRRTRGLSLVDAKREVDALALDSLRMVDR